MKATEANFLEFLKKSPQFVIPIYQRTCSWTDRECRQLWDDILRTGSSDAIPAHFTGSIVYIEKGLFQVSSQSPLLVIDGQQRLTTVMLILEALARRVGASEPVDGFSARKLRNYYLLNPLEEGERGFKLLLTQTDKHSLLAVMQQNPQPAEPSLRITRNFALFEEHVRALATTGLTHLCKGLAKLTIVDVSLSRDHDNPQLIFESMNSTGRELSQADLIRNFILMGLDPSPAQSPHRVLDKIMCRRCERMHFQPTGYRMVEMRCKNCSVQIEEAKQDHARHGENISLSMSFMVSSLTGSSPVTCVLIARNVAMAAFLRS